MSLRLKMEKKQAIKIKWQELLFTASTRSKARIGRCNRKRKDYRGLISKLALVDR